MTIERLEELTRKALDLYVADNPGNHVSYQAGKNTYQVVGQTPYTHIVLTMIDLKDEDERLGGIEVEYAYLVDGATQAIQYLYTADNDLAAETIRSKIR